MRIVKMAALGGALALSGALLVPATHAAADQPRTLPSVVATRIVQLDVDGDGHADEVTVEQNGPNTFVVNVVTYEGFNDVVQFTSTIDDDWGVEPWYGAARLDYVKGYEMLLLTSGGDGLMFRVLSWHNGMLVWEKAPKTLMKGSYDWYVASLSFARFGYKFTTSNGHRYVRDFELYPSGSRWKGTVVKSVWKAGAWKKVSSKKVNLSKKQAKGYDWLGGVKVIAQPL